MFRTISASALCLGALLAAAPGYCSTITPLGVITGVSTNDSAKFGHDNAMGTIEDYYTFTTTKTSKISASITNSFTTTSQYISDFTIELFRGLVGPGSQLIASGTTSDPNDPPDSEGAKLKALGQIAGNYYLKVTGFTKDSPSYSGSLAISVSAVPLPASAPMFGAAVLALGLVGYGVKRKKAAASA